MLKTVLHITLCLCFLLNSAIAQEVDSVNFTNEEFQPFIEQLREKHSYGKEIPEQFELPILVALSHYPELDSIKIKFVCLPLKCTMMAQPRTHTLTHKIKFREYVIFINNSEELSGFNANELSFNQFTGVLGHELAHITYFTSRNSLEMVVDGLRYYFRDFRTTYEEGTDMICIEHGLGWQLLDFASFVANDEKLSLKYRKKKEKAYMNDKDLYKVLVKKYKR